MKCDTHDDVWHRWKLGRCDPHSIVNGVVDSDDAGHRDRSLDRARKALTDKDSAKNGSDND